MRRATEFVLAPADAARLTSHLAAEEARIRASLADLRLADPVCAVALVYVGQEDIPLGIDTYALTEASRDAAFADQGEQALWVLWSPSDWDYRELVPWPSDDATVEVAKRVGGALKLAGCGNPEGAFACDLAYRLARADWSDVMPVTTDFASWASDHEVTHEVLDNFRVSATVQVIETYEARGWLRFPDEFAPKM